MPPPLENILLQMTISRVTPFPLQIERSMTPRVLPHDEFLWDSKSAYVTHSWLLPYSLVYCIVARTCRRNILLTSQQK